ncbi:MAG: hypothetical protein DRJ35_05670 [Thermoprotei archaeon]|nr:MAG: hypothetical protein DRJ35_05670 [Thermoprotei archaeon]
MKIGFIGTGMMGYPMAKRLLEHGFKIIVWNRTTSKAVGLTEFGAELAESPYEVAAQADIIHLMVADDNASRQVLLGEKGVYDGISPGKIIVNHSTVTPMHTREMSSLFDKKAVEYLAIPVMGGPRDAERGNLLSLAGGRREVIDRINEVLMSFSREVVYIGKPEEASAVKLAINSLFFMSAAALSESISLVESWGVSPSKLFEVANRLWLKSLIEKYGERLLAEEFPTSFRLVLAAKDIMYAVKSGYEKNQPLFLNSTLAQMFLKAASEGFAEEDYSRIFKYIRGTRQEFSH